MAMPTASEIRYMQAHITDDKRLSLVLANVIAITLAYIAVFLRFLARRRINAPILADDWWILTALIVISGMVTAGLFTIHFGLGRHIILVTDPAGLIQSTIAAEVLYCCSIVPIKFSILFLYHRIFPIRSVYVASMVVGAIVLSYTFSQTVALLFQCIPLSSMWTKAPGKCIDSNTLFTATATLNVLTDFVILSLPVRSLWQLKISKSRKLQLFAVFALGGCVIVFSIIRATNTANALPYDRSWGNADGAIWSILEVCVGVISACLPCLRPLFVTAPQNSAGSIGKASLSSSAPSTPNSLSKESNDLNGIGLSSTSKRSRMHALTAAKGVDGIKGPFVQLNQLPDLESSTWSQRAAVPAKPVS